MYALVAIVFALLAAIFSTMSKHDSSLLNPAANPTPAAQHHLWGNRVIVHPDHIADLERATGIHEFEGKMPRAQAEERAHADYKRKQHVEAAAHHLAGMKGAVATGDIEAARKHGVMYELHSKALGHDAVGPAHPEVAAKLFNNPSGFHRFRAHRGDMFAVPEKKAEEPVTKAEILHGLYKAFVTFDQLKATAEGKESAGPKEEKSESDLNKWAKAELSARKKKGARPCVCRAYSHPHRTGGGKCPAKR